MEKIKVTAEQIEHLPSDVHKKVAHYLIRTGEWILTDTTKPTGKSEEGKDEPG